MANTYTVGNIAAHSGLYTISASSTSNWSTNAIGGIGAAGSYIVDNNSLSVSGNANFSGNVEVGGDLRIGGHSLKSTLQQIESRLGLLHINADLEQEFDELRRLGDQYRQLESELLEKRRVWDLLKNPHT